MCSESCELLAILALESDRAKAYIVGEDLGTIDEKFRQQLMDSCVLSYRLVWFESHPPARFPEQALAAVTTHDLPTIAGLWTGSDLRAQRKLGLNPNEEGMYQIRGRLSAMLGVSEEAPVEEVIRRTYKLLSKTPSKIVSATLDDALAVEERPNMPGASPDRWPKLVPRFTDISERAGAARFSTGDRTRRSNKEDLIWFFGKQGALCR